MLKAGFIGTDVAPSIQDAERKGSRLVEIELFIVSRCLELNYHDSQISSGIGRCS